MNKLNQYRLFAILIPILCLGVGGWVVFNQYRRLGQLNIEQDKTEQNLAFQKRMIEEIGSQPLAAKEPMAPASDAEQAAFLEGLRTIANDSGVVLTKWNNVAAPPVDPKKPAAVLPAGVSEALSTLEVEGPYENVRTFLYAIGLAPRLLNFSGIKWARTTDANSTNLKVTITRYVSPPEQADVPPSSTPASAGATEKST